MAEKTQAKAQRTTTRPRNGKNSSPTASTTAASGTRPRPRPQVQRDENDDQDMAQTASSDTGLLMYEIRESLTGMNETLQDFIYQQRQAGARNERPVSGYRGQQYDDDYSDRNSFRDRGSRYGQPSRNSLPVDFEDRMDRIERRLEAISQGSHFGPKSGIGPQGERAFSGARDGNIDGRGIPHTQTGDIDSRTVAGRMLTDDEEYTDEQLTEFINSAPRVGDGSYDLRTKEGRALMAAGWIDEAGFELEYDADTGDVIGRVIDLYPDAVTQ